LADILIMGQGSTGSYALGSLKNNMVGAMCKYLLNSILEEVNRDLIKQLYELNGFDTTRMCRIDSDSVEETPIEELSKAFQRAASTGLIERDRAVLNRVRDMLGIDTLPAEQEVQEDKLTGNTSKSGEGMKTAGSGTSLSPNGVDTSSNNADNAA
jgi:phage gp29-like protein